MAAKKNTPKPDVRKSDYVRSLPASMTAAEVVAKAKSDGITLSPNHVHQIRSATKRMVAKKAGKAAAKRAARKAAAAPATPERRLGPSEDRDDVTAVIGLLLRHGERGLAKLVETAKKRAMEAGQ